MSEPSDPRPNSEAIDSKAELDSMAGDGEPSTGEKIDPGKVEHANPASQSDSNQRRSIERRLIERRLIERRLIERRLIERRLIERRLIERLSGWRLNAFFISAALNLGLLAGLFGLPLILNSQRIYFATAWVSASHCVFLLAVAGFRFPIATKFVLGFVHGTACLWALASIGAMPWVKLGGLEVMTLYMIPMLTLLVTCGGIVVAQVRGFHRSRRFSVTDVILLVSAFAVLFPLILQVVPRVYFTEGIISPENLRSAFVLAALGGLTCLVISNLYLKFIPVEGPGLSPVTMAIGWFLLLAIVNWNWCQFGFLIAVWILISLVPIIGLVRSSAAGDSPQPSTSIR